MGSRITVGVMGAGAVGCYIGGRLTLADDIDIVLVGRSRLQKEIREHGLRLTALGGDVLHVLPDQIRYETDPAVLSDCDLVLCCVKSGQTAEVAKTMADSVADGTIVVSMQNGVRNAEVLREHLPACTVLPGVVGFNVVGKGGGDFRHTTLGALMVERCDDARAVRLMEGLAACGFEVKAPRRLAPHQWAKLIINLNNAVSALSGAPTRDMVLNPGYRAVVAAVMAEGVRVMHAAGIELAKLRGLPVPWLPSLLAMPTPLVRLLSRAQLKADPEARSSMWQDLSQGRLTEVEYLNGEIVRVAQEAGIDAPINARIVELVHEVEADDSGSPNLSPAALQKTLGI